MMRGKASPRYVELSSAQRDVTRQLFALEYVSNGFDVRAAGKICNVKDAGRLFKEEKTQAIIADMLKSKCEAVNVTADRLIAELSHVAFANVKDVLEVDNEGRVTFNYVNLTREHAAAIAEIGQVEVERDGQVRRSTKIKYNSKVDALRLLMQQQGLLKSKLEVEGLASLADELRDARQRVEHAEK